MKTLMLLRHAKSDWSDPTRADHERPLNTRGEAAAARMARYFLDHKLRPDLILCSTAVRTRDTLARLRAAWTAAPQLRFDKALYLASAPALLKIVQDTDPAIDSLLVIGHNPGLQALADMLAAAAATAERDSLGIKFPTAALAVLTFKGDWHDIAPGSGRLVRFIKPATLA